MAECGVDGNNLLPDVHPGDLAVSDDASSATEVGDEGLSDLGSDDTEVSVDWDTVPDIIR